MEEKLIDLLLTAEANWNSSIPIHSELKMRIIEGKMSIDRWNFVTDNYITHPDNITLMTNTFEPLVEDSIQNPKNKGEVSGKLLGEAALRFNEHCPRNKIICFCSSGLVESFERATCIIDISDLV